tara:strand:- start:3559 stop:3999 length:441 start_codon:yes stop_codon:yes gene_type:complete
MSTPLAKQSILFIISINIFTAFLVFALCKSYTDDQVDMAMTQSVDYITKMPTIKVFNTTQITNELREQKVPLQKIVSYIERYIKLHKVKGIILIDSNSTLAIPDSAKAPHLTMQELDELSEKYGITSEYSVDSLLSDFNKTLNMKN